MAEADKPKEKRRHVKGKTFLERLRGSRSNMAGGTGMESGETEMTAKGTPGKAQPTPGTSAQSARCVTTSRPDKPRKGDKREAT